MSLRDRGLSSFAGVLWDQILAAWAHVREASRARSDEEFVSKLGGALQEVDESQLWLELLREECAVAPAPTQPLEKEASELMAIFTTMIIRTKEK